MIAVVEKCKENKEEARFLLESAPLEGFNNADYLTLSFGLESRFSKSVAINCHVPKHPCYLSWSWSMTMTMTDWSWLMAPSIL